MKSFPQEAGFKLNWRKYQQRVLDELETHLSNNHLHVIAPPGSGKTILGLEVALRLNQPTLVLAPTITIRNQWAQRFKDFFLPEQTNTDWISLNLKKPGFLTIATYQSLHAACSGISEKEEEEEESDEELNEEDNNSKEKRLSTSSADELLNQLRNTNISTLVVDEAHHLKNEWWKSLMYIKDKLSPTVVALTATPPYDVTIQEWERYIELCGPVDAEISVPELISEGDLAPHQDYLFFSIPAPEELAKITDFRKRADDFFSEITKDEKFIALAEAHPFYSNPDSNLEEIYSEPEFYSSILIFLNSAGKSISKQHMDILGNKNKSLPKLDIEWTEILLTGILFTTREKQVNKDQLLNLEKKCRSVGILEHRKINLRNNKKIDSVLSGSVSKLNSIEEIVKVEKESLGESLRMVILSDFIRKDSMPAHGQDKEGIDKIGIVPIFGKLRNSFSNNLKIGVLTGSLVIIPEPSLEHLKKICTRHQIDNLEYSPLYYDSNYILIKSSESIKHQIVHFITMLFEEGGINVLIGTKSLLGEGWDAPCINSLILASTVGSFVLSNQMRGRAIRTDKRTPDKTGNIWHLVCVDPYNISGGSDLEMMTRRFKSFVGVTFTGENHIENGLERLILPSYPYETGIMKVNASMIEQAKQRSILKEKWTDALTNGRVMIEEIQLPYQEDIPYGEAKSMYFSNTLKYIFWQACLGLGFFTWDLFLSSLRGLRHVHTADGILTYFKFIFAIVFIIIAPPFIKYLRLYLRFRDIGKDVKNIGKALLDTLSHLDIIETRRDKLRVVAESDERGVIHCYLEGGSTYEQSVFINGLKEIVGPVDNPRYIVVRISEALNLIKQKDYHSVPLQVGNKKASAEFFQGCWEKQVGTCELVYTRVPEGRKLLLKARLNSLAARFQDKSEIVNRWR